MRLGKWLWGAVLLILLSCAYAENKTLNLVTTPWEPYVRSQHEYHGYAYEIVKKALEAKGYQVNIQFKPWQQAMQSVNDGQVDAIFPKYITHSESQNIAFSVPFTGGPIGFYKLVGSDIDFPNSKPTKNLTRTFNEMRQYRFGVVKGYSNLPDFDNNPLLTKVVVNSDKENLEQLYAGQVQLILIDKFTAEYILNHQLPWRYQVKLSFMQPALGYKKLYLGVSKTHPNYQQIVNDFNSGLTEIAKNGVLSEIIDRDAIFSGRQLA